MGVIHSFGGGGGDGRSGPVSAIRARVLLWIGDRVARRVERYGLLRVRRQFEEHAVIPADALLFTTAACQNLGVRDEIRIGARFVCRGTLRREAFGGTIEIGDDVYVGDYSVISCGERVVLEDGVTVAYNVSIFDNDAHPLDPDARSAHLAGIMSSGHSPSVDVPAAPVIVERDAWIGAGATVLKGVRIGAAAVVGAGSVVTKDVPPGAIVAGNPARVVEGLSSDAR